MVSLNNKKLNEKLLVTQPGLKFWRGNSIISSALVGKKISVYNGKVFKSFKVIESMVGIKMGCFVFTRRVGVNTFVKKKS